MDALVSAATVIVISSAGLLVVLYPAWVAFTQDRAGVPASMAISPDEVRIATAPVLRAITSGPIEAEASDGRAEFSAEERLHVQDVAILLRCWWSLGAVALTLIALSAWRRREHIAAAVERGVFVLLMATSGGTVLVVAVTATGVALVARALGRTSARRPASPGPPSAEQGS